MIRRWIIRGLALTLLMLCVAAWVGSYFKAAETRLFGNILTFQSGSVTLIYYVHWANFDSADTWDCSFEPLDAVLPVYNFYSECRYHFLWIAYSPLNGDMGLRFFIAPMRFHSVLSALLLWFVWRKTKPKVLAACGAFPVEPAKEGERQP